MSEEIEPEGVEFGRDYFNEGLEELQDAGATDDEIFALMGDFFSAMEEKHGLNLSEEFHRFARKETDSGVFDD